METKKEKRLRYLLIMIFMSITAAAFFYKYYEPTKENAEYKPLAVVVQEGSTGKNPIVIMYEFRNDQHILAQFEIEKNNSYHFRTLEAAEVKDTVTQLVRDVEKGVWVELSGKWQYFDQELLPQNRSTDYKENSTDISFEEIDNGSEKWVELEGKRRIKVEREDTVSQVLSLSTNQDLWLILTNNGVKISTIATK